MIRKVFILLLIITGIKASSQDTILDAYIKQALESNIALKEKQSSYEKSILALKEAKGMFYPNVSLNARYTVAAGGRTIDFPVGDMLNPVYSTLNALNQLNGMVNTATGQPVYFLDPETGDPLTFPSLENESFPFLRPQEHETKIRVVQPILNTDLYYNKKIKSNLAEVEKYGMNAYKRQLIYEVKSAYYIYCQSIEVLNLINETDILVKENLRVSNALYNNNMVTIDNVYKSEAEQGKLEQKRAEAIKNNKMAKAYFNFLLNRELNKEISVEPNLSDILPAIIKLEEAVKNSLENRDELKQLENYQTVNRNVTKMNKSNAIPDFTAVIDYGFQGEEYKFTGDYDYVMASLVLQWDLFKGFQNKRKIEQARIDENMIANKMVETEKKINMQVMQTYYSLEEAAKNIQAIDREAEATEKAFHIIDKKYKEGQSPLIEYLDSRNDYTSARQKVIIAKYDYLKKKAEYEWAACTNSIEP